MNTRNMRRKQPKSFDPIDWGDRLEAPPVPLPLGESPIDPLRPFPCADLAGLAFAYWTSPPPFAADSHPSAIPAAKPTGPPTPLAPPPDGGGAFLTGSPKVCFPPLGYH